MKTRTILLCALVAVLRAVPLLAGDVYAKESGEGIALGNDFIELTLDLRGPVKLASLTNKTGSSPKLTDEGFTLQLDGTQEVRAGDLRVTDKKIEAFGDGAKRVTILLKNDPLGLEVRLGYELKRDDFFIRRTFALRNAEDKKDLTIHKAQIDRLTTDAELEVGGMGQPVFVGGSTFLGLEYPAAYNQIKDGQICLFHYPGKKLGKEFLDLKSEVIGVAGNRNIEDAFAEYLRRIRVPPRSFVLYNSWYDVRRKDMSNEIFIECFDDFKKSLIDKYGVRLNTFVIDDGYQDMQSIWKTDKTILPEDFKKLADYLKANGSVFGIWMPLTPTKGNLDLDWGREQGYEITDSGGNYCVSGPKFNKALREIIAHHIKEFGLNYYKHDFNSFRCAAEGHAHLPKGEYGFEANVDAYIDVLKYTRTLNPDVFLNVTGGMWLSPWWLMYADTVWRGGGDTGREGGVRYIEQRDDTMTYVDGVIWDRVVKERVQFPTSAMMTHGICYGRLCMLGGKDEPFHRWTEHIINYLAPGVMMIELYLTPSILSEEQWAVLGPAVAWAVAEQDVLAESRMTHGNPHKGEVYGYRHAKDGRLIWFLRNPSMNAQEVELAIGQAIGGKPASAAIVYPYRVSLAETDTVKINVLPYQTMVIEASKAEENDLIIEGCRYAIMNAAGEQMSVDLIGEPGSRAHVKIKGPAALQKADLDGKPIASAKGTEATFDVEFAGGKGDCTVQDLSEDKGGNKNRLKVSAPEGVSDAKLGVLCENVMNVVPMGKILVNGKEIKPKIVHGDGWRFFLVPMEKGDSEVSWEIPMARRATLPFSPREMTVSSWLFVREDLPKRRLVLTFDGAAPAKKRLPTPFANADSRCISVQERRVVQTIAPGEAAQISKDELANIKAAKLHVNVFGVDNDEKYRHKPVLLNGTDIGILPPNGRPLDRWDEKAMDIPGDKLSLIKAENNVVFTNPTGDAFKIGDIGLAVQLADGTWVETNREKDVHCSTGGWAYSEGAVFKGARTEPIRLAFPLR